MSHAEIDLPGEWEDPSQPAPRRRRRGWLIALLLIGALIAGLGVVIGGYLLSLRGEYEKRSTVSIARTASDGERPADLGSGTNYLLLGSDKRDPETAAREQTFGQRSDVMMLVHVPADGSDIYVLSFPRDLYVDIPGHGKDRINAALAFGGVPLTVATVENYLGAPIAHAALIDFEGIKGLVDALGGVDVEVPLTFEGDGIQFTEGIQHMDGETALTFVRQRYMFADGDFQRNRNQQALLKAILNSFISRDTLSDPMKIREAIGQVSPFLTTDDGLTALTMAQLGVSLRDVRSENIRFMAVPHGEPFTTSGGASVVGTDEEGMDVLRRALAEDAMGAYYSQYAGAY